MTDRSLHTYTAEETQALGRRLASLVYVGDVLLLSGDLGAGKTQLTKGLAEGLDVREPVTSPTFNILLVHQGRVPLYHIDLYRLESAAELEDIDYFATIEGDGVAVVEWGDRFAEAAPTDGLSVVIDIESPSARRLLLHPLGPRGEQLAEDWLASWDEGAEARGTELRP